MDKVLVIETVFNKVDPKYGSCIFNLDERQYNELVKRFGDVSVPFHTFPWNGKQLYNLKILPNRMCKFDAKNGALLELELRFYTYTAGKGGVGVRLKNYKVLKECAYDDDHLERERL